METSGAIYKGNSVEARSHKDIRSRRGCIASRKSRNPSFASSRRWRSKEDHSGGPRNIAPIPCEPNIEFRIDPKAERGPSRPTELLPVRSQEKVCNPRGPGP